MTVKLLLNLGTRHPVVGNVDRDKHAAGTVHDFGPAIEAELVKIGHAELVAQAPQPKRTTRKRKTETETPTEEES